MKIVTMVVVFVMMVFIGGRSWGQNLVGNGSFEEVTSCPPGWSSFDYCVDWFTEVHSPDAIATCSPYPVSVPNNWLGFQYPFEGDNYAGLLTYVSYSGSYAVREIIGAKLIDSMVIGNAYHFSMRVCWAFNDSNGTVIATNGLGAQFSKVYHNDDVISFNNHPQLHEDSLITDSINWGLLQWDYVADSAYKYIYLGNFYDNSHIDTLNGGQQYLYAYYYIDSVNLFCASADCVTGIKGLNPQSTFSLSRNPVQNLLTINFLSPSALATGETIAVYDVAGRKIVLPTTFINNKAELTTTTLPNGIYLLQIINTKTGMSEVGKFVKE
ncbi:MAG TPA: T9SS type A sorting domain-containing protein [Chitinophagales bacterium]|nr:T9SS type A sorting domain-containing protein [Chitinophagales bacterium]